MLDVAACAKAILDARPGARRAAANNLNSEENSAIEVTVRDVISVLFECCAVFDANANFPVISE